MKSKPAVIAGLIVGVPNLLGNAMIAPVEMVPMLCCPVAVVIWLLWFVMGAVAGWLTVDFAKTPLGKPGQQGAIAGFIVAASGTIGMLLGYALVELPNLSFTIQGYEITDLFSVTPEDMPGVVMSFGIIVVAFVVRLAFFGGASILAGYMMTRHLTAQKLVLAASENQPSAPLEPTSENLEDQTTAPIQPL